MPVPRISREDLKARLDHPNPDSRPILLDVRLKYPYEHSTLMLPGAVRAVGPELLALPKGRDIVAYDSDPDELVSSRIAADLIEAGYAAAALRGGIVDWLAANFPTDTKTAPKQATPEPGSLKG